LPAYYENFGPGMVVSSTINKYITVLVHTRFDNLLRFTSFKEEIVDKVEKMEEGILKESLKEFNIKTGIDIITVSDVPPGTGMGSSGAFTVGLLNALQAYTKKHTPTAKELAQRACEIEINKLSQPIGKQDQYAAAFGGFALIEFNQNGKVKHTPINMKKSCASKLAKNSLMLFLNKQRSASAILKKQVANISDKNDVLTKIKKRVPETVSALKDGNIKKIGEIIHETWQLKKTLATGISNEYIDNLYHKALGCGAYGGKVLGAGGGGFLFLLAAPEKHKKILETLKLKELPFTFQSEGTKLLIE